MKSFKFFTRFHYADEIAEDEMDGAHSTNGGDEIYPYIFLVEKILRKKSI